MTTFEWRNILTLHVRKLLEDGSDKLWLSLLLVMLSLASVGIAVHFHDSADRLRAEAFDQAQRRGEQVINATATAAAILFRDVDVNSQELANSYDPRKLREFEKQVWLAFKRLPAGSILEVAVIDANGYLEYSTLGVSEKVFLREYAHYRVHLESAQDQFFISKPLQGRVSKQWSIEFSRPIRSAGKFEGVLVMSLSPAYLEDALKKIALDTNDDTITVLRRSGEVLAVSRNMEDSLGKSAEASHPFLRPDAPMTGHFDGRSESDQVERLFHWYDLRDYPVVVLLGVSKPSAFEPVERAIASDKLKTALGLALLWAATVSIFILVRRVAKQSRTRQRMEMLAMNDSLTGLKSRHALMAHLEGTITQAAKVNESVGVLYMDLNGFKPINDGYGHAAGDEVLQAVSARIQRCVRSGDIAARIGGDEFVVVVAPLLRFDDLTKLRDRIALALETPIDLNGASVLVGASIGRAIYPAHGRTADELLAHADGEMYLNKAQQHPRRAVVEMI